MQPRFMRSLCRFDVLLVQKTIAIKLFGELYGQDSTRAISQDAWQYDTDKEMLHRHSRVFLYGRIDARGRRRMVGSGGEGRVWAAR